MNYICTISSSSYLKYTLRLVTSIRNAGYRGEIIVLSTDEIACNETVVIHEQKYQTELFPDNRWVQFEIDEHFKHGDKIMYLDADMIVGPDFPFKKLFQSDLLVSNLPGSHDVTTELPTMSKVLGKKITNKYIASPFVFKVNRRSKELFTLCRISRYVSEALGFGTLFAFNIACRSFDMSCVDVYSYRHIWYTLNVVLNQRIDNPTAFHYGGAKGKTIWEKEYLCSLTGE